MVKERLIENYGYGEICATDVLNYVASHLRPRRRQGLRPSRLGLRRGDPHGAASIEQDHAPLPRDRPRPDQAGPAQVHLAGRADRASRAKDVVSIPLPADRHPALPLRREAAGAASARARASRATRSARRRTARAAGRPAQAEAQHMLEVEVSLEELAEILGEELELPHIEPRGKRAHRRREGQATPASAAPARSRCATSSAPSSEALRGRSPAGTYDPEQPDHRARSARTGATAPGSASRSPQSNAVIIYMMDVSGSMGDEQKEIVRIESFWIDTWLRTPVQGPREPLHRPRRGGARRSTATPSSTLRESGGTMISSAYKLCAEIIETDYPPDDVEHLPVPLLRRRQLGRPTTPRPASSSCASELLPDGEPLLLRPGREPLRLGPVHQGPATSSLGDRGERGHAPRSPTRRRSTTRIKHVPGEGEVSRGRTPRACRRAYLPTIAASQDRGLRPRLRPRLLRHRLRGARLRRR